MKRSERKSVMGHDGLGRWGVMLAAGLGGVALATSCTDANDSLTIVQLQKVDEACLISQESGGTDRLVEGVLDVGLDKPYGYNIYPLVSNNLPSTAENSSIEPNRVSLTGAEIKVMAPIDVTWPANCPPTFNDASSANLNPGERGALSLVGLRACHAAVIRDLFVSRKLDPSLGETVKFRINMRAQGRHGGTSIQSDPFEFPIRVCYGCLQTGFSGAYAEFSFSSSQPKVLACDRMVENPYKGNPCNPAQDYGPVLCCAQDASGEKLVCPGIPALKPGAAPVGP